MFVCEREDWREDLEWGKLRYTCWYIVLLRIVYKIFLRIIFIRWRGVCLSGLHQLRWIRRTLRFEIKRRDGRRVLYIFLSAIKSRPCQESSRLSRVYIDKLYNKVEIKIFAKDMDFPIGHFYDMFFSSLFVVYDVINCIMVMYTCSRVLNREK